MEAVLAMIQSSKSSFEFRIYKDYSTIARHTGIVVFLDGVRRFSVDFGHEFAESGSSGSSGGILCFFTQPNSVITLNKPKKSFNIIETCTIQWISLESSSGKERAMGIIYAWMYYRHGDYDLSTNNCRHFCRTCIMIDRYLY